MVHPRIVPWSKPEELDELKKWFYPDSVSVVSAKNQEERCKDMRMRAVQRVKSYQSKGSQYLPHVIDSTAQITSAIVLDEERSKEGNHGRLSVRLSYTMALIRFVNGLLDPTQQSQFAIPLHTLAKRVGLSSWFVDLRHWGTHERELPSIDMLRTAAKEALKWLWFHYWNDDELEEEEEESTSDDRDQESLVNNGVNDTKRLIKMGIDLEDILLEYRWVWENSSTNLISSSNFLVEDYKKGRHKKATAVPPHERINAYIHACRENWRRNSDKLLVVEACFEHYNPLLFELMMVKLNGFELEVFSWLVNAYELQLKGQLVTPLKRKYSDWSDLKKKFLKKFIMCIDLNMLAMQWNSWDTSIEQHPSFMTLWICRSILERLNETNNLPMRKKRKKKKHNDNFLKVESDLRQHVEQLSKRYGDSEFRLYNLSSTEGEGPSVLEKKLPNEKTDEILNDLASLRERLKNSRTTRSTKSLSSQDVKLWVKHPQWVPKPFGVL